MNYNEFSELLNQEVKYGDKVWICDYRFNNILEKPIRHVKPTKVVVVSNEELPKNKRVYYSVIHFRPIGKKGEPLKQIIAPFDNTGFRSYTGVSLNIFLTKEECYEHYIDQCRKIKKEIAGERYETEQRLNRLEDEVNKEIDKFK